MVKTLEYVGSKNMLENKIPLILEFCDLNFDDLNIAKRLELLQNLQNEIISIDYTDDLKQRIKQNIVQWDYLTLVQVDQLITNLLNDTKAPTDLNVLYRCGNVIALHWKPLGLNLNMLNMNYRSNWCIKMRRNI